MKSITKNELEELYKTLSNKEICDKLQISHTSLIALIKRAGLKTKGKGNKKRTHKIIIVQEGK